MIRYYRRDGTPYPNGKKGMFEWAKDFENFDLKIVAKTKTKGYEVSTVWLGLNHAWDDGPPLIFETMIFSLIDKETSELLGSDRKFRKALGYQQRYSTEQEAIIGHEKAIEYVNDYVDKGDPDG